jgi:hypothetical protein
MRHVRSSEVKAQLRVLKQFNEKVTRLEATRLAKRLDDSTPSVTAQFKSISSTRAGDTIELVGEVQSVLDEHDQDDIDAFVLTYRMFVQRNDSISIPALAKVYESSWMPAEAAAPFTEARRAVNDWLDSGTSLLDGQQLVTRRELVDVILYGGLAHTDPSKVPIFTAWMRTGAAGFFWAEFMVTVTEMLRFLRFFRELNQAVIANHRM